MQETAGTLQAYLEQVTGANFAIEQTLYTAYSNADRPVNIWLGHHGTAQQWQVDLAGLDKDGFTIAFGGSDDILIIGPSDWGTEFGVYAFLEEYVGVRWLMPGPDGEHIPDLPTLDIEKQAQRQSPAFVSRHLFGLKNDATRLWARRNRLHSRIKFHHNMYRLFPPEEIGNKYPHFLPRKPISRALPGKETYSGWQPCYMVDGIDAYAIWKISEYFNDNPTAESYSLGINDGIDSYRCADRPMLFRKNYVDRDHWSEIYFQWANRVVEEILAKYPDKWFGCLAYNTLAEPPDTIDLHSRIIPYITSDRLKWIDPEIRKKETWIHKQWQKAAPSLGWYDYIYGTPYLIPRIYFSLMADNYRFAADNGVVAMAAEAYPNWGEGPKLYLALRLWWNPHADAQALLDGWYHHAVGPSAAKDLALFYKLWEDVWTQRVPKTSWVQDNKQYLPFYSPQYLGTLTYKDLENAYNLINNVVAKADTPKRKARARILAKAYEYYYASSMAYLGLRLKRPLAGRNSDYFEDFNRQRKTLIDAFESDPVLRHPIRYDRPNLKSLDF